MIRRKGCLTFILTFIVVILFVASIDIWGKGIVYPEYSYVFKQKDAPPLDENIRFENCSKYNQELYFWYTGVDEANPFNSKLILELFTSKPYKKLYIKEFGYENNGKQKAIIKNKNYMLPKNVKVGKLPIYDYSWHTANGYYMVDITPWKKYKGLRQMPSVNWSKVFPDKKLGDKFPFQMKVVYQFDDEPEKTLILDYEVEVKEYYWINPLVKMLFW